MDGDKRHKLYGPENIRTETIYLRRSFKVICARPFADRGNYSRETAYSDVTSNTERDAERKLVGLE